MKASQREEHHDFEIEQSPFPRKSSKSKSPEENEHDKPGRTSRGTRSNSAQWRKSSKASRKEPKLQKHSPENEDGSLHRGEQLDQDIHDSHKTTGPFFEQDVFKSEKSTKSVQSSRKSLVDDHSFRGDSPENLPGVCFSPEELAKQPGPTP